jgi:hypothetical protein
MRTGGQNFRTADVSASPIEFNPSATEEITGMRSRCGGSAAASVCGGGGTWAGLAGDTFATFDLVSG